MTYDVTIDRDKYIGGSDIACIMGISPFKSRYQLLLEKAGLATNDFNGNEYTEYGNIMEDKIRAYVNEKLGTNFIPERKIEGSIRYHADGVDFDQEMVLEVKTTSQVHSTVDEYKVYLVQLLTGMKVFGFKKGVLAVYERNEDFSTELLRERCQIFTISIEPYILLTDTISCEIERFLCDLQKIKDNPLLCEEDFQPKEVVAISKQAVALEERMTEFKALEAQYKAIKQKLYDAMVEANVKTWTMPNGTKITRVDGKTASVEMVEEFDFDTFKAEHQDLAKEYTRQVERTTSKRNGYAKITLVKG